MTIAIHVYFFFYANTIPHPPHQPSPYHCKTKTKTFTKSTEAHNLTVARSGVPPEETGHPHKQGEAHLTESLESWLWATNMSLH